MPDVHAEHVDCKNAATWGWIHQQFRSDEKWRMYSDWTTIITPIATPEIVSFAGIKKMLEHLLCILSWFPVICWSLGFYYWSSFFKSLHIIGHFCPCFWQCKNAWLGLHFPPNLPHEIYPFHSSQIWNPVFWVPWLLSWLTVPEWFIHWTGL